MATTNTGHKGLRKAIAGCALFGALAVPGIAFAATSSADANDTGGYCVKSGQGCTSSHDAPGSGAGAFGAFGNFGDVTHDYRGGADGWQTGINNSTLVGNRQGNLTDPTP